MPAIQLLTLVKGKGVSGTVQFLFTSNGWWGSILLRRLRWFTQVWSCNVPIICKMFSQQVVGLVAALTLFLHGMQYVHCSASPKCSLVSYSNTQYCLGAHRISHSYFTQIQWETCFPFRTEQLPDTSLALSEAGTLLEPAAQKVQPNGLTGKYRWLSAIIYIWLKLNTYFAKVNLPKKTLKLSSKAFQAVEI